MASDELEAMITMLRGLDLVTGDPLVDRAAMGDASGGVPADVPHEMVTVAGRDAAWITADRSDAAMLYLHGGGYVMGGIHSHGPFAARLSSATGLPVLVPDYRLGPEDTHPAALDDALAAFDWLTGRGIDPARIVVAGDSAGGGLTLATLVALRDRGIRPAAGVAMSPWTDLTCANPSHERLADEDPLVKPHGLRGYAAAYAGDTALDDPLLSPAFADPSGLAPVLIQVGGVEVLLDDSVRMAEAIERAGGEVTLQTWDEAVHVFQMLGTPESDDAIGRIVEFVHARL